MSAYSARNYSKLSTLLNIVSQYGQQSVYNYEQVEILEATLESLHSESLEAESIRQQLDSVRGLAAQTASAETAALARLRVVINELIPE
jgi:site-specific recombinase XerC